MTLVAVIGAGITGVTTAYKLMKQGMDVTVFDRNPYAAMETSFANAGEVSPGYSSPWAGPGVSVKAVKWLLMGVYKPGMQPMWSWWAMRTEAVAVLYWGLAGKVLLEP